MSKIIQLPQYIVSRIAAGEVIERPAFAVKELLENSLDANSKNIKIEIEQGGLKKIKITDDGEGMSLDDLLECYKPHTTSKLKIDDSLVGIKSMGFRGEALSSISAVSEVTIQSRPENQINGNQIYIQAGQLKEQSSVGMPQGTIISIENLFYTIPVRKKFLKSSITEFRYILEVVLSYALAYTDISFTLIHNKKTILQIHSSTDQENRISQLLGNLISKNIIPIKLLDSYLSIDGYISYPQLSSRTPRNYIFINNRKVKDKLITSLIKNTYGTLLEPSAHPFFILFINLPPEMVDVNIHPRKEEVSILNQEFIFDNIKKTISETLINHNITYSDFRWKGDSNYEKTKDQYKYQSLREGGTDTFAAQVLKESVPAWNVYNSEQEIIQVIQIHKLYILVQTKNGITIYDQHAAHERILYEQYLKEYQSKTSQNKQHTLNPPYQFKPSIEDEIIIQENVSIFDQLGFNIQLHEDYIIVNSIPELVKDHQIEHLIYQVVQDIKENVFNHNLSDKTHRLLAYLACRNAIKAGDLLNEEQSTKLIKQLENTPNKYTCPHGRPVKIDISLPELHKLFKRIK